MPFRIRKHLPAACVALAYTAVAVAQGGFHPKAVALIAVVTWLTVVIAAVAGRLAVPAGPAGVGVFALTGFAVYAVASLAWSPDPGAGLPEALRVVAYAGVLLIAISVVRGAGPRPLLAGVVTGTVVIGAIALLSRALVGLPGDERLVEELPSAAGLLSFPIGYWNGLAAAVALGFVGACWFAACGGGPRVKRLAAGSLPLLGLVIVLAESRGALAAILAGTLVMLVASPERRSIAVVALAGAVGSGVLALLAGGLDDLQRGLDTAAAQRDGVALIGALLIVCPLVAGLSVRAMARVEGISVRPAPRMVAAAAGALSLLALAFAGGPGAALDAFQDPTGGEAAGGSGRYQYWDAALGAFASEPVAGLGAGGYETWWNQEGDLARRVRYAHSFALGTAADYGVIGLAAVLALFGAAIVPAARRVRDGNADPTVTPALALIAAWVLSSMLEWTWQIPAATIPMLIAVAVTLVAAGERRPGFVASVLGGAPARLRLPALRTGGLSQPAFVVLGVLAVWASTLMFAAETRLSRSAGALAEGRIDAAAREARAAALLLPFAAQPRLQLAEVEAAAGNPDAALAELELAIERAPQDWELWIAAASLREAQGDGGAATAALARAVELNPGFPVLRGVDL